MNKEISKEQLSDNIKEMKAKLQAEYERTFFQTPKGSLNGMMHTVDYGGIEPQHTVVNLQTNKVAYIGFESDDTLEKGLSRAEHYNQWALESENLDGNRTGVTADTINVTTMSSNPNLDGFLPIGSIHWPNEEMLIHTTFPKDVAKLAAKGSTFEDVNEAVSRLLYDLKKDAIVNPSIEDKEIPINEWTQGKSDGFTQAASGNLEHVGGYIASMAGVKPEDAKQLLTPKQLGQYVNSEIKSLELHVNDVPLEESYDKMVSLLKGVEAKVKFKRYENQSEKEETINKNISKRSRERGSGLGR